MLYTPEYLEMQIAKHAQGGYGISGHRWAKSVNSMARQMEAGTMLDYGCGQGLLKQELEAKFSPLPYQVIEYDPAIEGKQQKPLRADLVVCGDVLEHIEPDCLYEVLDDIRNIARSAVYLVVDMKPALKYLADGRNAHLIVKPAEWWLPKLRDRWRMRLFQDFGHDFLFCGTSL